jgi:hypothetical protein
VRGYTTSARPTNTITEAFSRNSSKSVVAAPSNSNGGKSTNRMMSWVSSIPTVTPAMDARNPATSRAMVEGSGRTW